MKNRLPSVLPTVLLTVNLKMPKHKLYKEVDGNLHINSSLHEPGSSQKKRNKPSQPLAENSKPDSRRVQVSNQRIIKPHTEMESSTSEDEENFPDAPKKTVVKSSTSGEKKNIENMDKKKRNNNDNESVFAASENVSDSDSDSESESALDSMSVKGCISGSYQKLPYTSHEDEQIVKYVLQGERIFKVGSVLLWRHLENKKENPKRTFQSLKNRFLRNIKPHLFTTFSHLIKDEETVRKILLKFPELKRQLGRKETLTEIKVPHRVTKEQSQKRACGDNYGEHRENFAHLEAVNVRETKEREMFDSETLARLFKESSGPRISVHSKGLISNRRAFWKNNKMSVNVYFEFNTSSSDTFQQCGIYEKYLKLKENNKLTPCPNCGRCGDPEEETNLKNFDSDVDSDAFILNSVDSKIVEKNCGEKRVMLRKNKNTQNHKRKKKNSVSECFRQRSCSPSLLNDVNEVDEFDENVEKDKETVAEVEEVDEGVEGAKEKTDSTPEECSSLPNTDSIYQSTVKEFRRLIDSDEEEILVKKCLKKNLKTIDFAPNLSMDNVNIDLDSFFMKSNSPTLRSEALSDTITEKKINSESNSEKIPSKILALNMLKMFEEPNKS